MTTLAYKNVTIPHTKMNFIDYKIIERWCVVIDLTNTTFS